MRLCTIDGSAVTDRAALHALLREGLKLPEWYGNNLDAAHDCLTALTGDTILTVTHAAALREALGRYGDTFLGMLRDCAGENPHLRVVISEAL